MESEQEDEFQGDAAARGVLNFGAKSSRRTEEESGDEEEVASLPPTDWPLLRCQPGGWRRLLAGLAANNWT